MNAGALLCATLGRGDDGPETERLSAAWRSPAAGLPDLLWYEGAALWLHRRLGERGWREHLPEALRVQLRGQVLVAAGSALRIEAEARLVLNLLERAGLPVIPLKGAARRILASRWPVLAARPLGDVDLLLPPDAAEAGWQLLRRHGFGLTFPGAERRYDEHHHLPGLVGPGKVSVELHRTPLPGLPPAVGWERYSSTAEAVQWQGLVVRVPGATELAWHAISHAATDGVTGFRLRHLLDLVGLVECGAPVDWDTIAHRVEQEPVTDGLTFGRVPSAMIRQWLGAAVDLLGPAVPARLERAAVRVDLPALLEGRARLLASGLARHPRLRARLLTEWTRGQLGWALEPVTGSLWHRARGSVSGLVARGTGRILVRTGPRRAARVALEPIT